MRSLRLLALLASFVALAPGCKKDGDAAAPNDAGDGVFDGVARDVDTEIKGADESFDQAVDDVKGAGKDVGDAVSKDDDDDADADDDAKKKAN